ncbi:hypothetical protein BX616_010577 [Lobosporangium transversale]|uniref:Uncharacterized protein n=1 Tax=Lobosporangium transversale TaxID=64571 RepID=A0A1Y2H0L1_9FUNG|nr:hypothetical protein BCR41DRAFT_345553 [Lobosporangium transversale]KAF9911469.1 hypothetical protein BX616_010577 [Lobosporangium transversale]ORZ27584.1 hypothetical protein BCR41DRAFT_345553 [Lobosporangium transversale]|eukprot:XP_021885287.1 hypothetical protein BCR41DRAFT_345553 [Lobosporangium transversale]
METQHVSNPWQQQQRQFNKQDIYNMNSTKNNSFPLTDEETRSFDDFFEDHKKVFYQSQQLLQQLKQQQQQHLQKNTTEHQFNRDNGSEYDDEDGETDSQDTAWSRLGMESPLNQSTSTLTDSTTVFLMTDSKFDKEGDVLELLVQTLQSEVKDTRATVHDLETRLNLAEDSNKRIVEELKMLLAEAEMTLQNAGEAINNSDNNGTSSIGRSTEGDEDSNVVYNRICVSLQLLIDEAQTALQKNSSMKQFSTSEAKARQTPTESHLKLDWTIMHSGVIDNVGSKHELPSRRPARNSLTLLTATKMQDSNSSILEPSDYSPLSFYSANDEVSRIYWRQKHDEQHDRYRKSCQRLTLELDERFHGLTTDSDDSEANFGSLTRRSKGSSSNLSLSSLTQSSTPPTPTSSSQPLQGILRSSKTDERRKERLKKKYQVQFLNPDIDGSNSRQDTMLSTSSYRQQKTQGQQPEEARQQLMQRQYTSRSVGSNRSRGVLLQLYELWQQTWLRTRIMHVVTGSVEIVIIIWVVIKASRATLTWFGIQPSSMNQLITFVYGYRNEADTGAKQLYEKIRKDGLRLTQLKTWNRGEPESLVQDVVAGAVTLPGLLSPSNLVYGPAKKVVGHAVSGVALALLSGGARRLIRKL